MHYDNLYCTYLLDVRVPSVTDLSKALELICATAAASEASEDKLTSKIGDH
jgi:hypothetical protein